MRPSYVDDLCNGDGYEAAHEFRQNCHLGAFFATHLALIELPSIIRENRMDAYRTRSVKIRIFIESIKCISVFTNFNFEIFAFLQAISSAVWMKRSNEY